jgi:membrane-bound serine protease (ClpP class)
VGVKIVAGIIVAVLVIEIIEHVLAPLVWAFMTRKKRSVSGVQGLLDEVAEVKEWKDHEGYVLVRGESWKAVSLDPLSAGDEVVVERVDGLTLRVRPREKA